MTKRPVLLSINHQRDQNMQYMNYGKVTSVQEHENGFSIAYNLKSFFLAKSKIKEGTEDVIRNATGQTVYVKEKNGYGIINVSVNNTEVMDKGLNPSITILS